MISDFFALRGKPIKPTLLTRISTDQSVFSFKSGFIGSYKTGVPYLKGQCSRMLIISWIVFSAGIMECGSMTC